MIGKRFIHLSPAPDGIWKRDFRAYLTDSGMWSTESNQFNPTGKIWSLPEIRTFIEEGIFKLTGEKVWVLS